MDKGPKRGGDMSKEERREQILNILKNSEGIVSGAKLSEKFAVSRQIIVQDIAMLRERGYNILSTQKGYVFQEQSGNRRVFKVKHTLDEMLDEMNLIVDCGGKVEDVFVFHKLYGVIKVSLGIASRRDAQKYMDGIKGGVSVPLEQITSGYHYHTVSADSKEILDDIQQELMNKGYLVALRDFEPVNFWGDDGSGQDKN